MKIRPTGKRKAMNIAIIGRTEILYKTAELLHKKGYNIKLIITSKEAPEYLITSRDFQNLAKNIGAKYLYTSRIHEKDSIETIKGSGPLDVGISVNYVNIIPQSVIDLFPIGILNAHGGDLPRYRGNACQAWAIINGESRIGLCVHKMVGGELDSGDIIAREYMNININTKIGEVIEWMTFTTPGLFFDALSRLQQDNQYILEKQSMNKSHALRCLPRLPEDGRIQWEKSNTEILRLINASNQPFPGAFCSFKGERMIIWDASLYDDGENCCAVPGQISSIDKRSKNVTVATGRGKLQLNWIEYGTFKGSPVDIISSVRDRLK